jgi:cytochrome c oxidase subunit 2
MLEMTADDVIHSFWVPSLQGKKDLLPGYVTTLALVASRPGQYEGQCAEFCGFQHAHMGLDVVAHPPAEDFYRRLGAVRVGTVAPVPPKVTWERPELRFALA